MSGSTQDYPNFTTFFECIAQTHLELWWAWLPWSLPWQTCSTVQPSPQWWTFFWYLIWHSPDALHDVLMDLITAITEKRSALPPPLPLMRRPKAVVMFPLSHLFSRLNKPRGFNHSSYIFFRHFTIFVALLWILLNSVLPFYVVMHILIRGEVT